MASVILFVEGGGDKGRGRQLVRLAFIEFFREFGGSMPDIRARGAREEAKDAFLAEVENASSAFVMLLVDAEAQLRVNSPRQHLHASDGWELSRCADDQVHLMVQAIEAWMIADRDALRDYFGQGFSENPLPGRPPETIPKDDLKRTLKEAGRQTNKKGYNEIADGTAILAMLDPATVRAKCQWCRRLFLVLSDAVGIPLPDLQ